MPSRLHHNGNILPAHSPVALPLIHPPTPATHIFWDWNGTLLDDTDAGVAALNRMLSRRGWSPLSRREYRERFKFPVKDFYVTLGFDFHREDWDAIANEFLDAFLELGATPNVRPEALTVLNHLKANGWRMSVLSALEQSLLEQAIETAGLRPFFERVHGTDNRYGHSKIETGRNLCAEVQADSGGILMIGDTDHDFEVSKALGAACVLVANGHQHRGRLEACGCRVIDGLGDLLASPIGQEATSIGLPVRADA